MKNLLKKGLVKPGLALCFFLAAGMVKGRQADNYKEGGGSFDGVLRDTAAYSSSVRSSAALKTNMSGFSIKKISAGKIFTPDGDAWNGYFQIEYENLGDAIISAKIYDLRGRYVSAMTNDVDKEILRWDGKNTEGKTQNGGVYIYQIEISGYETAVIKGTVVLAK